MALQTIMPVNNKILDPCNFYIPGPKITTLIRHNYRIDIGDSQKPSPTKRSTFCLKNSISDLIAKR